MTVVVVGPIVHDVVAAKLVVGGIVGVVVVGQSQHMSEFVAHRAYACRRGAAVAVELSRAGICVDGLAVDGQVDAEARQLVFVWPDGIGGGTGVLSVTGKDDIDHVHLAVAIAIVLAEIHQSVVARFLAGVFDHLAHMHIRALHIVVVAVIAAGAGQPDRTYHIKLRFKQSCRLRHEIIPGTACGPVISKSLLVEHAVMEVLVERERDVGKLHQQHGAFTLANGGKTAYLEVAVVVSLVVGSPGHGSLAHGRGSVILLIYGNVVLTDKIQLALAALVVHHRSTQHRGLSVGIVIHIAESSLPVLCDAVAVGGQINMVVLVALQIEGHGGTVGLFGTKGTPLGRNSHHAACTEQGRNR